MSLLKKIVFSVLLLLFISLIGVTFYLVPAHVQVRKVVPPLPTINDLRSLKGADGPSNVSYILTSSQELERGRISHLSIIIEWPDSRLFMIDAGMDENGAREFSDLLKKLDPQAKDADFFNDVSSILQEDIDSVSGIGFTHLHIDHTQGVKSFCEKRGVGVQALQLSSQAQKHNFNTDEGASIIESSCLTKQVFEDQSLVKFENYPGLAAFTLGGHTPGSTLWVVAIGDKILLFSGDITNDKVSIDEDKSKGFLYSYLLVPENTQRTSELRKWLFNLDKNDDFGVIVSHDLDNTKSHIPEYSKR